MFFPLLGLIIFQYSYNKTHPRTVVTKTGIIERVTNTRSSGGIPEFFFKFKEDATIYSCNDYSFRSEAAITKINDSITITYIDENNNGTFNRGTDHMTGLKNNTIVVK